MTFIITEPCIGTCDTACVDVCPVDCIHGPIDVTGAGAEVAGLKTLPVLLDKPSVIFPSIKCLIMFIASLKWFN